MKPHLAVELSRISGLDLLLGENGRLAFGPGLPVVTPSIRHLADMRPVLADPAANAIGTGTGTGVGADELYFMYRDVARSGDQPLFAGLGIRYDLTVLAPGSIGREPVKTFGHYHPAPPGSALSYPEVYEVLHGRALYLLQREAEAGDTVEEVVAVFAGPGQKVLIPPGYGHVTVNAGPGWLVMDNVVEATFTAIYEPFRRRSGAACYALRQPDNRLTLEPNPAYDRVPPVRRLEPVPRPDLGLKEGVPLYRAVIEQGDAFRYLVEPAAFAPGLSLC